MFKEILQIIISEGVMSKSIIAQQLDVPPEVVEDMLKMLIDRGYLREDESNDCEPTKCAGCPVNSHCSTDIPVVSTITVTVKGQRYAAT